MREGDGLPVLSLLQTPLAAFASSLSVIFVLWRKYFHNTIGMVTVSTMGTSIVTVMSRNGQHNRSNTQI